MKINSFFSLLFICFFAFQVQGAELNASLDKNIMTEGDILTLTLEYSGDSNETPDLSNIQQDFKIVSNYVSRNINYINGVFSQIKKWRIGLQPLKTGKLTIKPIRLDGLSSNYAEIEVKPVSDVALVPDSRENANSPYFKIEQQLLPLSPYVQQQATLIVTIYDSIGLQNGTLKLSEKKQQDWILVPLMDKPVTQTKTINGKHMNIRTFAFAAFPQKSGKLEAPQTVFDGYYIKDVGIGENDFNGDMAMFGVNFHNIFGQQVPIKMRAKAENIYVKPVPDNLGERVWLPLKKLELETVQNVQTQFKSGDAISRKIKVIATGMQENNFPTIAFPDIPGFKQYPEKPVLNETAANGEIVTTAEINTVYIPTESGKFTFPKMEIEWFNVETEQFEKTTLPAEKIEIYPNPDTYQTTASIKAEKTAITPNETEEQPSTKPIEQAKLKIFSDYFVTFLTTWRFLAFLIIALLAAKYGLGLRFNNKSRNYRNVAITAIRKRNYHSAKDALINWAKAKFERDDIKNFNMIADLAGDEEFRQQLNALNKLIYSQYSTIYDGEKFIQILKKIDRRKRKISKNDTVLPNLYD